MRLLTKEEVGAIVVSANTDMKLYRKANYRWGQAIYNNLPKDVADAINGTDQDMFHIRDEDVATTMLLNLAEKM